MTHADYEACYRVLGLSADADWEEVRTAYRRLAQRCHPDRHNEEAHAAEDEFKAINNAFHLLSGYYREHGELPGRMQRTREELLRPRCRETRRRPAARQRTAGGAVATGAGRYRVRRVVAVLIVIGTGAWLLLDRDGNSEGDGIGYEPPSAALRRDLEVANSLRGAPLYFSYGATKDDVRLIQGKPTRIEGEVWYYGRSRVYFENDAVVNWEIDLSDPLRVRLTHKKPDLEPRFTYGASKAEVRAIEGEPDRATDKVWEYGLSRVYFEQDAVVAWENNPIRPLRVYE